MSGPHVFIDESERGSTYYVAAAIVPPGDLGAARKELRGLLRPGMRRLHMTNEKDSLKRAILTTLRAFGLQARVYSCRARPRVARPACIEAGVRDAVALGAERLVIENNSAARADRQLITHVLDTIQGSEPLRYEHIDAHEDPLLWAADALAWAVGADGRWRPLVDPLIAVRRTIVP